MPKAHKKDGRIRMGYRVYRNSPIFNIVGSQARERRGFGNEDVVFESFCARECEVPEWFRFIGRGTYEQDAHKGIDFVVLTDVGKIFLQIKSSAYYADKFRHKQGCGRYNKYIALVIVDAHASRPEDIRVRVISAVAKVRRIFITEREEAIAMYV